MTNWIDRTQQGHKDPPLLSESSFTALRLFHSLPKQVDRESRVLAVGPFTTEWTQMSPSAWRNRYQNLRGSLRPNHGKFWGRHHHRQLSGDSQQQLQPQHRQQQRPQITTTSDVRGINQRTLTALADGHGVVQQKPHVSILQNRNDNAALLLRGGSVHFANTTTTELPSRSENNLNLHQLEPISSSSIQYQPSFVTADSDEQPLSIIEPVSSNARSVQWGNGSLVAHKNEVYPGSVSRANTSSFRSRVSGVSSDVNSFVTARESNASGSSLDQDQDEDHESDFPVSFYGGGNPSIAEPENRGNQDQMSLRAPSIFSRTSTWQLPILAENRSILQETMNAEPPHPESAHHHHHHHGRGRRLLNKGIRKFFSRKERGEVIAAEKLLVMVKTCKRQYIGPEFNEVEDVDTRVFERWKEYIMVARNTGHPHAPLLLQFYKSRKIAKVEKDMARSVSKIDTLLTLDMNVKFYSTLDKTIVFWKSTSKGTLVYIIRSRTHGGSLRWLALFLRTLGIQKTPLVTVGLPTLGFTMRMLLPLEMIRLEQEKLASNRALKMPDISYQDMKSNQATASPLLLYLYAVTIKLLNSCGYEKKDILRLMDGNRMGLAWRRYDRLEWLDEGNEESIYYNWVLQKTHDLEIRPKKPYSSFVTFEDGVEMEEPVPIEGFLVRLTTWTGQVKRYRGHLHKLFFRAHYFHTHDNLLFYSESKDAFPPLPSAVAAEDAMLGGTGKGKKGVSCPGGSVSMPKPKPKEEEEDFGEVVEASLEKSPLVYEVMPFKTNSDGEIEWLQGSKDAKKAKQHDNAALYEIQRRISILCTADGLIDLCEVEAVQRVDAQELNERLPGLLGKMSASSSTLPWSGTSATPYETDHLFEIVMASSGRTIVFQAFNAHTRDIWVQRLSELARYWKRRLFEDTARINEVRQTNLQKLNIRSEEDGMDTFIGEATPKWQTTFNSVADVNLFPAVGSSWSRSITMQGILFQKSKKHASFRQYHVVLCNGQLILYNLFDRTPSGKVKASANHTWYQTIDLSKSSCYVYSGPITEGDLLQGRDKSFDAQNPGSHFIPRVYADGWKSNEDEGYRCFVLWFGKKRPLAASTTTTTTTTTAAKIPITNTNTNDTETEADTNTSSSFSSVKLVNRLGVQGVTMVFMTRSRQDRDLWVLALNHEIERVAEDSTQDITIK